MTPIRPTTAVPLVLALALAACSSAPPAQSPRSTSTRVPVATSAGRIVLTPEQIALVRQFYGGSGYSRGSGRGRGNGLPPGIARNLERGKPLPPGIAKQYLPRDLVLELPPLERGLDYIIVAGKLLLVEAATQRIREVLLDAVFS